MKGARKDRSKPRATRRKPARRQETPSSAPGRWAAIVCPLAVVVAGFAAFAPALDAQFVNYDDSKLFETNTSYRGFDAARLRWMFTTTFMGHYQPLTWVSSALDYELSGMDPASYHRNNLILHALSALVLYFVGMHLLAAALRLEPGEHPAALRAASAVAALLFAIHPLRVESVAWASERRDVLSVFFLLPALWAYLRAFEPGSPQMRSRWWFAGSLVLLLCSLLSKAWGMSFVLVVAILDVYPLRRLPGKVSDWWKPSARGIWVQKLPYLVLGLAAAVMAGYAQRSALQTVKSLAEWGVVERMVQACYGLAFYMWKTIWPTGLAALYELPYRMDPFEWRFVAGYLGVAGGVVLVLLLRRRWPSIATVSVIYVVILAPVLGVFQSGPQLVADKYSYVSCMGWALLAGGGLLSLWRVRGPRGWGAAGAAAAAVVLAALFILTYRQTGVWQDSKSLWSHALAVRQPSSVAHAGYGILLRGEGRVDGAIEHYRLALELRPDSGNAWFALANALKQKREYSEAEQAYRQAVQFMAQKHNAYLNLGNMYYNNLRQVDDAIAAYRAAVEHMGAFRSKMFSPTPYLALGIALGAKGEFDEARRVLEVAREYSKTRERAEAELARLPKQD